MTAYGGSQVVGSIRIYLTQNGSDVTGSFTTSDLQSSIAFNLTQFGEYMGLVGPFYGDITGTVNTTGSLKFTYFMGYPAFPANIAGNIMAANFEGTFLSDVYALIVLKKGSTSETVIGPTEDTSTGSFNVQKVSEWWSSVPPVPQPVPEK